MKLGFLGACREVTGSMFLVETQDIRILIDCGMFQGKEEDLNYESFLFDPKSINYIILTHAHIDHTGLIPKVCKEGFEGKIIATEATVDLCSVMLPDSGHIQEAETEWQNRKRSRTGKSLLKPLYTAEDAYYSLKFFEKVKYNEVISLSNNIRIIFRDAGHILGSSIIEMYIQENSQEIKLLFSGDLGNESQPIVNDPTLIEETDYLIMESTYGNRLHETKGIKEELLLKIINDTLKKGGNIVIPAFAVERTQEILYYLDKFIKEKKLLKSDIPIFVDSPLAIEVTEIFKKYPNLYDKETVDLLNSGENPFSFANIVFTQSVEESKAINSYEGSCIIISSSGMCDAGRIKHHLKHNLWRSESSIVIVGYQAEGTLGRKLLDGAEYVKIFDENIKVNASIYNIDGFSGHADRDVLMKWLKSFKHIGKIFLVHGEEEAILSFSNLIKNETLHKDVYIPYRGDVYTLSKTEIVKIEELNVRPLVKQEEYDLDDEIINLKKELMLYFDNIEDNLKISKFKQAERNIDEIISKLQNLKQKIRINSKS